MALSGQTTVAAAGTEVVLGSQLIDGPLMVKALDTNTGIVAVGNDGAGAVSVSTGMRLAAGDVVVFASVGNLGSLLVDVVVGGEGVAWLMLEA